MSPLVFENIIDSLHDNRRHHQEVITINHASFYVTWSDERN